MEPSPTAIVVAERPIAVAGYATSLETAPQATLATTGVVVGALWGGLVGLLGAKIISSKHPLGWTLAGAVAGATILGIEGNAQGTALKSWLAQY